MKRRIRTIQFTMGPGHPPSIEVERHVPVRHPQFLTSQSIHRKYHPSPELINYLFHITGRYNVRCYHTLLSEGWFGATFYTDYPPDARSGGQSATS